MLVLIHSLAHLLLQKSTQSPMGDKVCGVPSKQNFIGKGIDSEANNQGPTSLPYGMAERTKNVRTLYQWQVPVFQAI